MSFLCPHSCEGKTEYGYCRYTWCINPLHSNLGTAQQGQGVQKQIITNADKLRAMSDEEIEAWYWWMHKEMMRYTDSRVFLHDWLKKEASNG